MLKPLLSVYLYMVGMLFFLEAGFWSTSILTAPWRCLDTMPDLMEHKFLSSLQVLKGDFYRRLTAEFRLRLTTVL